MKTMDELFKELMADKKLKAEAVAAYESDKMDEFAAAHGVNMTKAEIKAFLDNEYRKMKSAELSDDDLENVAGGVAYTPEQEEVMKKLKLPAGFKMVNPAYADNDSDYNPIYWPFR